MTNSNKQKAKAFRGSVLLIALAVLTALVFIGCPKSVLNNKQGGKVEPNPNDKPSGEVGIEGVWKFISGKDLKTGIEMPVPMPSEDGDGTELPWMCLSEGKVYAAMEKAGKKKVEENGLFKNKEVWGKPYTYKGGVFTVDSDPVSLKLEGNIATMTMTNPEGDNIEQKFERVSSPTIAEFKAKAK